MKTNTMVDSAKEVKPTRNPIKENAAPVAPATKVRPPVDMKLDRIAVRAAKPTRFTFDPAGFRAVPLEYWVPTEHDYENLLDPHYWSPIADVLKRHGDFTGSIICVRTEDHQYYAELYITEISMGGFHTNELFYKQLGVLSSEINSDRFKWIWNPALKGYDILRQADGVLVVSAKEMKRLQSVKDWLEKMEG